jgi:hypothetical protein
MPARLDQQPVQCGPIQRRSVQYYGGDSMQGARIAGLVSHGREYERTIEIWALQNTRRLSGKKVRVVMDALAAIRCSKS